MSYPPQGKALDPRDHPATNLPKPDIEMKVPDISGRIYGNNPPDQESMDNWIRNLNSNSDAGKWRR